MPRADLLFRYLRIILYVSLRPKVALRAPPHTAHPHLPSLFLCGLLYFGVVKVIDDDGTAVCAPHERLFVDDVKHTFPLRILTHVFVQHMPIRPVPAVVNVAVKREKPRVFLFDVFHNARFEVSAQIEVFQPDIVAKTLDPVNYRKYVCDPGKDRRHETGGAQPLLVALFHGGDPALDGDRSVHVLSEIFVQRIHRPAYQRRRIGCDQIEVAQHKIGLCDYDEIYPAALHLFEERARAAVFLLLRKVGIGDGAYDHGAPRIAARVIRRVPIFDIEEAPPRLAVPREALHETRVTIFTSVRASHVRIDGIAGYRQIRLCHHRPHFYRRDGNSFLCAHILPPFDNKPFRQKLQPSPPLSYEKPAIRPPRPHRLLISGLIPTYKNVTDFAISFCYSGFNG